MSHCTRFIVMCMRPPVCIRCLSKTSAKSRSCKTFLTRRAATAMEPMSLHTNLGRREQHPVLPIDSQATGARQQPDGASDKLGGTRQEVRRASTTEEVTLMLGHHGTQLFSTHETPVAPVVAHQVACTDTPCRSSAAATGKTGS